MFCQYSVVKKNEIGGNIEVESKIASYVRISVGQVASAQFSIQMSIVRLGKLADVIGPGSILSESAPKTAPGRQRPFGPPQFDDNAVINSAIRRNVSELHKDSCKHTSFPRMALNIVEGYFTLLFHGVFEFPSSGLM